MRKLVLIVATGAALFSGPAYAATAYLVSSWFENGNQMCRYDNGTVLNVGGRTCPTSIQG